MLVILAAGLYALLAGEAGRPAAPESAVLWVDLGQPLAEGPAAAGFPADLLGAPTTLHEVVAAIDRAAGDARVAGLVGELGGDTLSPAAAQELRDAVARFRASGKRAIAYADSFGELGPATLSYYLATAFERILIQPLGTVGLTGIRAEVPFAAEALADLGIEPAVVRRGTYKSFPETFTQTAPSPAHREMLESLSADLYDQVVTGIAAGRGLSPADVRALVDRGPFAAEEALAARLVDALIHRQDLEARLAEELGRDGEPVDARAYLAFSDAPAGVAEVGIIHAAGVIVEGEGANGSLLGAVMGADEVADAIADAVEDPDVAAIVLRVDSGGGSVVASEVIGRAVARAGEAGKPLIVSMGAAAASGGYWISTHAAAIVAEPGTLTGSIGVFAGKPVLEGLWSDLGIAWTGIDQGLHAGMWSTQRGFTAEEVERLDVLIDGIYGRFIDRVAEGRRLDRATVQRIAQGRVWTGAQAFELGLVDRLGGLDAALAIVRERIGAAEGAPLDLVPFPRPETALERLIALLSGRGPFGGDAAGLLSRLPPDLAALAAIATQPAGRMLMMPPIRIEG
jgi:protease-4